MISEFLFYEENASKEEKISYIDLKIEIRELLKDDFNRSVLSEILLDLQKDVSGNTEKRLFRLYQDLGLHLDAYKKLKSWKWHIVSKGILELTQMQVQDAYSFITKFINDRRSIIRKHSEIATVSLKNEGVNYFLDTTKYKISEWQQLKILEVLRNFEEFEPPKFNAWLTSSNKDVVLFSLRLIKYYNQNDANTSIIQLIRHKNNQIKEETINCIKKFCVFEALPDLKKVFWKCNVDIKVLILDTIASIGSDEEISFLKLVEKKDSNFIIKSKAQSAINAIAPDTILPTKGLEEIVLEQSNLVEEEEASKIEEIITPPVPTIEETNSIKAIQTNNPIEIEKDLKEKAAAKEEEEVNINNLEVSYEEVSIESQDDSIDEILLEIDDSPEEFDNDDSSFEPEINFLPVVIDDIEVEENQLDVENSILHKPTTNIFDNNFFEQDNYNKFLLLDTIEDLGSLKDLEFLNEIIEKEENYAIKERAIGIFNIFSEKRYSDIKEENSPLNEKADSGADSIFKQLFAGCDKESKLILLDEIVEVGDRKEISFLNTLLINEDKDIKEKAQYVKNELLKREPIIDGNTVNEHNKSQNTVENLHTSLVPTDIILTQSVEYKPSLKIEKKVENSSKNEHLIPLEFCFLLDELEIELSEPSSLFDIDFELTQEFYQNHEDLKKSNKGKKKK